MRQTWEAGAIMKDDEIRELGRAKLSDGTLLNQIPVIASDAIPGAPTRILLEGGGPFPDPCTVCNSRPTQVRYPPSLTFHDRCHAIWQDEVLKSRHLSN